MFEVGFTEIVLILGLALLVLGPEKLPGLAQKIGRWTGRARSMARQLRTQLEQEVTLDELAKSRPATSQTSTPSGQDTADQGTADVETPATPAPPYDPQMDVFATPDPVQPAPQMDLDHMAPGAEPAQAPADVPSETKNVS
ncbi:Sec-independent protein translocase protein TatB [Povalibacter sp.]|uniref:Sec-independent protein translocase protein TatB n=1 Tax=Povalibacter sp. TaxID=1962978 RepID=UPI002F3EFCD8